MTDFRQYVGQKLSEAKSDLMSNNIRNARGYMETCDRIRKSTENLYFSLGNQCFEPVAALFESFSERPGLNDVKNVAAVDIVDINIMATQQSVMGYLSAERGMDKPVDTAYYQALRAMNEAGGFTPGETTLHPFRPISPRLNLGSAITTGTLAAGAAATANINFAKSPLSKGGVTLTAILVEGGNETVVGIGQDKDGDGKIFWDTGGIVGRATVDYNTGVVTLSDVGADTVFTRIDATAIISRTGQADGSSTLKVKPVTETVTLKAKPNRIILENSFEENAYLNKQTYNVSSVGVQMDFGKRAVNQLLQLFTFYLDLTSVVKTAEVMLENEPAIPDLDLTAYTIVTSEAGAKNDFVNNSILRLIKSLQQKSGKGPSCYLVCSEGAVVLGNNPMYFTANANFDQHLAGMIGTYRGYPVIRHHALDGILDDPNSTERYAFIGALHKSPDGQIAPTMFGEYLPPYSISPALNYDNPAQFSQALLSSSVTEKLVEEVCSYFRVLIAA